MTPLMMIAIYLQKGKENWMRGLVSSNLLVSYRILLEPDGKMDVVHQCDRTMIAGKRKRRKTTRLNFMTMCFHGFYIIDYHLKYIFISSDG